jgi:uncharacterized protein (UPF0332 family)
MTSEQSALLQKARDNIRAAKLLAEDELYDISISRAYYAMFYVAEAFLSGEGLTFSKHSAVISAFGKHFAKTEKLPAKFHRYLIEGENSRNVADYDTEGGLSKDEALMQIGRVEEFMEFAEKMIDSIPEVNKHENN